MLKRGILRSKALRNPGQGKSLIDVIDFCGLRTGLLTCIDAGDRRSYTGDRRYVYDLSGNNNHWRYGIGGSVGATTIQGGTVHPLFYGKVGGLSQDEYFSGSTANATTRRFTPYLGTETYDDGWHKDGATFSAVFIYFQNTVNTINLLSNQNGAPGTTTTVDGIGFMSSGGAALSFAYDGNPVGNATLISLGTGARTRNISFAGLSFNENGNCILRNNFATSTTASTASTNPTNPGQVLTVGGEGDGGLSLLDRNRIYAWALWSTVLSSTDLEQLYLNCKQTRWLSMS